MARGERGHTRLLTDGDERVEEHDRERIRNLFLSIVLRFILDLLASHPGLSAQFYNARQIINLLRLLAQP
jgi:hypothetical protein